MKVVIYIDEDVVTARVGSYEVSTKADVPEDVREALEFLYDEHIVQELLRELTHEIY